ncbi:RNA polymerase sigma factor [Amycolatopsis sp. NPDC054798]
MTVTRDCPRTTCVCAERGLAPGSCPVFGARSSPSLFPQDFIAFHDAHRLNFVKYARFRGLSWHDAEDAVSDAFVLLYRARDKLMASDRPEAFAFKVLRDAIADFCRQKDRRPHPAGLTDDDQLSNARPDDQFSMLCTLLDFERALERLPARQADCLRLSALLDQDTRTIAQYLGIGESTVRSHLNHARQSLAALEGKEGRS